MKGIFRKTIISLFLFLFTSFAFAEELIGFNGIKFGSTREEVEKIMIEKGWINDSGFWKNGIYGGASGCQIRIEYDDGIFYGAVVSFSYKAYSNMIDIINIQKGKYNLVEEIIVDNKGYIKSPLVDGSIPNKKFQAYYRDQLNGNYIYVSYDHHDKIYGFIPPSYNLNYFDKKLKDKKQEKDENHIRELKKQKEEQEKQREEKIKESIANDL